MEDDFGSAFTGQTIEPAQAMSQWTDWLDRPGNRTALAQMGLQLMQPVGIGQTAGGQIAQAVGAGGEAVARQETSDLKERVADAKMQAADERLRILQQNADAGTLRATSAAATRASKKVGGLTDLFKARAAREDRKEFERQLDKDAAAIEKQAKDEFGLRKDDPVVKEYGGLTRDQIREKLRATRKKPQYGSIPSNDEDSDPNDEDDTTPSAAAPAPPTQGARQAPDGNWYVPDPKRPGKYLRVSQ